MTFSKPPLESQGNRLVGAHDQPTIDVKDATADAAVLAGPVSVPIRLNPTRGDEVPVGSLQR